MGNGNFHGTPFPGGFFKKFITQNPGCVFNGQFLLPGQLFDVCTSEKEINTKAACFSLDKRIFLFGLGRPEAMVDIKGSQGNIENRGQAGQHMHERHGIGSSRNSDKDPFAGLEQLFSSDQLQGFFFQRMH